MEKTEVCFIRLYPDNPEDALIIKGLGARRRKGEKSRVIKDVLYAYFRSENKGRPELKSTKKSDTLKYEATTSQEAIAGPLPLLQAEIPSLSDHEKETLKKNLDQLSEMFM